MLTSTCSLYWDVFYRPTCNAILVLLVSNLQSLSWGWIKFRAPYIHIIQLMTGAAGVAWLGHEGRCPPPLLPANIRRWLFVMIHNTCVVNVPQYHWGLMTHDVQCVSWSVSDCMSVDLSLCRSVYCKSNSAHRPHTYDLLVISEYRT